MQRKNASKNKQISKNNKLYEKFGKLIENQKDWSNLDDKALGKIENKLREILSSLTIIITQKEQEKLDPSTEETKQALKEQAKFDQYAEEIMQALIEIRNIRTPNLMPPRPTEQNLAPSGQIVVQQLKAKRSKLETMAKQISDYYDKQFEDYKKQTPDKKKQIKFKVFKSRRTDAEIKLINNRIIELRKSINKIESSEISRYLAGQPEAKAKMEAKEEITSFQTFLDKIKEWAEDGYKTGEAKTREEKQAAMTAAAETFAVETKINANIECIHNGNNKAFKISDTSDPNNPRSVVLLFEQTRTNEKTIEKLRNSSYKPSYLAKNYYFSNTQSGHMSVMEWVPDKLWDKSKKESSPSDKISAAIEIGKKISPILNDLKKQDVVWTDLKSDNILLREDGSIAIADLKCFNDIYSKSQQFTKELLPKDLHDDFQKLLDAKGLPDLWDRMNNYQLANILYQQVTGNLVVNNINSGDEAEALKRGLVPTFDFNNNIFNKTSEGPRLAIVINGLATNTLHYTKAAELLAVLNDEKEFTVKCNELRKQAPFNDQFNELKKQFPNLSTPEVQSTKILDATLQQPKQSEVKIEIPVQETKQPTTKPISPDKPPETNAHIATSRQQGINIGDHRPQQVQPKSRITSDHRAKPRLTEEGKRLFTDRKSRFIKAIASLSNTCAKLMNEIPEKRNDLIDKMIILTDIKSRVAAAEDEKALKDIAHNDSNTLKKIQKEIHEISQELKKQAMDQREPSPTYNINKP